VATTVKYKSTGSYGYGILAVNPTAAKPNAAVPLIYKTAGASNAWTTGIQVYNAGGSAADVDLTMVRSEGCTVDPATYDMHLTGVPSGQSGTFAINQLPDSEVGSGWYGSAFISSANNIAAVASLTGYDKGAAGTYMGVNYND
jgi:hypothetical protein